MTQERRRYGFVLERQSSLAKHNMAFYEKQQALVAKYLDNWTEIAKSREQIPETVENMFTTNLTVRFFFVLVLELRNGPKCVKISIGWKSNFLKFY